METKRQFNRKELSLKQRDLKLIECKTCKELRGPLYFDLVYGKKSCYFYKVKCRVCKFNDGEIKWIIRRERDKYPAKVEQENIESNLSKLSIVLEEIKNKGGFADVIDCYKIIDVYVDIYGVEYTTLSIKDELEYMLKRLKDYYLKNKLK